ncbi:hypothetical protein SUGI_0607130 [Cryptomeria japonica]|uniref:uncharacterized protein LOC131069825 n=1 Tax=Cryptomeria japonica TaxID=3369 RepID=UPI002414853B|nr:uncharacterized protein LOC131069825 [Cryptomeria japonica]GLJ30656.1 hypothetical protein SUGI_0607130 [Cryptomeria japonica]
MELPEECCRKRERANGEMEMNDMTLAKRHYSECSSESEGFSELLCKDDEDSFLAEDFVDANLVSDIMKSLADEIMSSEQPCSFGSAVAEDCNSKSVSNVDIEYLLGATDDELGIPPSPNTECQVCNAAENPVADLLDNLRAESIGEEPFHLCSSDCWCALEEQDETSCPEWLVASLNAESSSSAVDQETLPLLEAGAVM